MDNFGYIKVKNIKVYAKAGATLDKCVREALLLAVTERRDVILTHNEEIFHISVQAILTELILQGRGEREDEYAG